MKNIGLAVLCIALLTVLTISPAVAGTKITGDGGCAKCWLGKAPSCGNVIKTAGGKIYYLKGDVQKPFHKNLCQGSKKVSAKGTVEEKDGTLHLHVKSIELAE